VAPHPAPSAAPSQPSACQRRPRAQPWALADCKRLAADSWAPQPHGPAAPCTAALGNRSQVPPPVCRAAPIGAPSCWWLRRWVAPASPVGSCRPRPSTHASPGWPPCQRRCSCESPRPPCSWRPLCTGTSCGGAPGTRATSMRCVMCWVISISEACRPSPTISSSMDMRMSIRSGRLAQGAPAQPLAAAWLSLSRVLPSRQGPLQRCAPRRRPSIQWPCPGAACTPATPAGTGSCGSPWVPVA
jgi:hypothetical protein